MDTDTFFDLIIVQIVLIVVVAYIVHHASGWVITWLTHRMKRLKDEPASDYHKRQDTIRDIIAAVTRGIIWLLAFAAILRVFNFDLAALATGAGFVGIVIGLGAQATIRDYVAGFFILVENQYRVGDIVSLSGGSTGIGVFGVVEEISLRITKIRDLDGTLNVVRNGEASVISNTTFEYSSVVINVGVAYDSDIDAVERVMNAVGVELQDDDEIGKEITKPIQFLRVDSFADSSVNVKAIGNVKPAMQWSIAGEYRRRLLKAFAKEGIEIPFPQVVVHNKHHSAKKT